MFNACNRTIFFTQILKFFKLLVKNTINISCAQITPSHKCDKNQLCNTVTNIVKHTLHIISLLFSLSLTQKPLQKKNKKEKKKEFFFSIYIYYSPNIEL